MVVGKIWARELPGDCVQLISASGGASQLQSEARSLSVVAVAVPLPPRHRKATRMRDWIALTALLASCVARTSASELKPRYDVVVVGGGVKESLLAGLLASHGKEVLHLEGMNTAESNRLDLQQLAELTEGPDAKLAEQRVGKPTEYSIERAPKMFMASGRQLQLFVSSGAWQHMNPPGFKRVQRSLSTAGAPMASPTCTASYPTRRMS